MDERNLKKQAKDTLPGLSMKKINPIL